MYSLDSNGVCANFPPLQSGDMKKLVTFYTLTSSLHLVVVKYCHSEVSQKTQRRAILFVIYPSCAHSQRALFTLGPPTSKLRPYICHVHD